MARTMSICTVPSELLDSRPNLRILICIQEDWTHRRGESGASLFGLEVGGVILYKLLFLIPHIRHVLMLRYCISA